MLNGKRKLETENWRRKTGDGDRGSIFSDIRIAFYNKNKVNQYHHILIQQYEHKNHTKQKSTLVSVD